MKADRFEFRKKFVIAPPDEKAGKPTEFLGLDLPPGNAMEIDRDDILRHLGGISFAKGFVVIQSASELDVVAYTAAPPAARAGISAMHMETRSGSDHRLSRGPSEPRDTIAERRESCRL